MSYLGYNAVQNVAPSNLNILGSLQAGQNFSEGLLAQHQALKIANLQQQYTNAPDEGKQEVLGKLAVYSPQVATSIREAQQANKAQRDEFLARGANDILQAPPEMQSQMHDQLLQQGIKSGFLPAETAQHIGKFDQNDIVEMQNLVRKAQPLASITPAAQLAALTERQKQQAEAAKLQAETGKLNSESAQNNYMNQQLFGIPAPGQLSPPVNLPTQGSLTPYSPAASSPSKAESVVNNIPPAQMAAADQGMSPSGTGEPLTGDAYLAQLPPNRAAQIRAYATGKMNIPSGRMTSPQMNQLTEQQILQYDPTADTVTRKARQDTYRDFMSGKSSNEIKSLNTLSGHIQNLAEAGDKLDNGSWETWNSIANKFGQKVQNKAVLNPYKLSQTVAADEIVKLLVGSGGSLADRKEMLDTLSSSASPEDRNATIQQAVKTIYDRSLALADKYKEGMGTTTGNLKDMGKNFINPDTLKFFKKFGLDTAPFGDAESTPKEKVKIASEPSGQFAPHEIQAEIERRKSAGLM